MINHNWFDLSNCFRIDASKLLNKFCDYNLHILEAKAFYPLHWKKRECLYKSAKTKGGKMSSCLFDEDAMRNKTTFAVHTWYTLLRRMGQANNDIPAESPYAKLSKAHCPNIYHTHMTKLKWIYLPLFDVSSIFVYFHLWNFVTYQNMYSECSYRLLYKIYKRLISRRITITTKF